MGYNDGGKNRTDRLKRHKREQERLAKKRAAKTTTPETKTAK